MASPSSSSSLTTSSSSFALGDGSSNAASNSVEGMYKNATILMFDIRSQLERLEEGEVLTITASGQLAAKLNSLSRLADALEKAVVKEGREETWRIRAQQLVEECKSLRTSMYEYMNQTDQDERNRTERDLLLEGRSADYQNGGVYARPTKMSCLVSESESLRNANRVADDIEMAGEEILYALEEQKNLVSSMRMKLGGLMDKLGLSKDVMKTFKRRVKEDKWLVYGGMILTVLILVVLMFWVK